LAKFRQLQTNFSSGQVDPRMLGREDTTVYANGAAALLNSSPLVQGGVRRRPGTNYLATLQGESRIENMEFNETQLYVFAFSNGRIDIFDEDGAAVTNLTSQPWNATTMWEMRLDTNGDTTIITHKDFPTRKLLRTGASTFTSADLVFEVASSGYPTYEPFYKYADNSTTIKYTGTLTAGASGTLVTSAAHFVDAHVGVVVRIDDDDTGKWKQLLITAVTNTTTATATVKEAFSSYTSASTTTEWNESAFSAVYGYPRSVAFHQQRLWFGGSLSLPSNIWGSKKGAYFNFDAGSALDAESIQVDVGTSKVNEIRHLHSGRHLLVFTDRSVGYVVESDTSPVSPTNFIFRAQVPYGIGNVSPQSLDGATIYIQDTGKVARELIYSDVQQAYTADAISLISNEMISGAQDLAVLYGHTGGPEQFALVVNTDTAGSISAYHSIRSEKISGWYPWTTTGQFISVTTMNQEIFACVKRTVNSSTVYYLEKFDFGKTVDCAKSLSSVSGTTWSGLSHLVAASASVVQSNIHHGNFTVNGSGQVTLTETATSPVGGLDYTRTITDLPVSVSDGAGSYSGEYKRVARVILNVYESVSFSVSGYDFIARQVSDDLSAAPSAKSGKYVFNLLGWDRDGQITISQSSPLPFTLLSIYKEVSL